MLGELFGKCKEGEEGEEWRVQDLDFLEEFEAAGCELLSGWVGCQFDVVGSFIVAGFG